MSYRKLKGAGNSNNMNNLFNNVSKIVGNNKMSNNKMSNNKGTSLKSNKVFVIIGIVLLLIILSVIGYFLYKYFTDNKKKIKSKLLIPYIHNATLHKTFNNSSLPKSISGNEYNINMWLYVNDYNYRNENDKCILFLGSLNNGGTLNEELDGSDDIKKEGSPSIWLKKHTNTLVVVTGLQTSFENPCNNVEDGCSGSGISIDKCEIENFPIQKWVNLNVSLRNNALDIFMNGKLIKSCILSGAPIPLPENLYISPMYNNKRGFNGYISKLEYTNKALDPNSIMDRYEDGPTLSVKKSFF